VLTRPPSPGERSRCRRPRRSHLATRHRRSPSRMRSDVICRSSRSRSDSSPAPSRTRACTSVCITRGMSSLARSRGLGSPLWSLRPKMGSPRDADDRRADPVDDQVFAASTRLTGRRILAAARTRGGADDTKASGRGFKGRRSHPPAASSRTYGRREPGSHEPPPSPLGPAHQPLLGDRPVLPLVLRRASPPPRRHRSPWR
jgi:hypothetical protein